MGRVVCSFEGYWRMAVVGMHEVLLLVGFGIYHHVNLLNSVHFIAMSKETRTGRLGSRNMEDWVFLEKVVEGRDQVQMVIQTR